MGLLDKSLVTLIYYLCIQTLVESGDVAKVENQIICPDSNPINCYPKLFQPEEDWKVVREGQIIPPGLDIRMDFESGLKEAKVSYKNEMQGSELNHALVVTNTDPGLRASLDFIYGFADGKYGKTLFTIVDEHFNELIDWSSDRESGIEIARNISPLLKLTGLFRDDSFDFRENLSKEQVETIQEKTFRILSLCFQNNHEAQEELLHYLPKPVQFLQLLTTKQGDESDLITKRKLSLLGILMNNRLFNRFFHEAELKYKLIDLYSKCENDNVRERIMTILKNSDTDKRDNDETDDEIGVNAEFAKYVQERLVQNSFNSVESLQVMQKLAKVKTEGVDKGVITIQGGFLDWLDREINQAKTSIVEKRDGDSDHALLQGERDRLAQLVELRHGAFGNRLGTRRDLSDEL